MRLSMISAALASDVVTLTDASFNEFIDNNKMVLVKFYAPWCGHCKSLAPEYELAATELKGKVPLADVDATVEKEVAKKYEVNGYPTLKWFVDGEATDYGGGRDKAKIVEWIQAMSGPAVVTVTAEARELEMKEPSKKPFVTLHKKDLAEFYSKFANKKRADARFLHVESDENKITMQHQGEEVQELKEMDADKLEEFFNKNKSPLVGELNGNTYADYVAGTNGLIWFLFKHDEGKLQEAKTENFKLMKKTALKFKGIFSITYTDTVEFASAIDGMLGVKEFPAVAIQKKAGGKQKFVYDGEMDADKIIQYIQDVHDGKIVAKLKSEPIPEEQGDVTVVVGDTLMEIVYSKTQDVLFEVYAPWCGHCKKLEPEYDLLGKKVTTEKLKDLLVIAKMDGVANDSPTDDIEWGGFPTIKFIKAGSTKVESYEAGRTAKDMWAWLRENSSHKEEITKRLTASHDSEEKHDEL